MPVISSPTRSWYSSNIMSRSASRIRWRITCLAVWAAMRPKSAGVTSRSPICSEYSARSSWSISGSSGSRISPVSGSTVGSSTSTSASSRSSSSGGSSSSNTLKSALSRSMSTRAYLAAPGCFLYAERRASSSASISLSEEMPFSRSRTCTASTISFDIGLALQQVASLDVGVRDGDDARVGGDRHPVVGGADQLPRETPAPAVGRGRLDLRPAADVAPEVVRLAQRPLRPRRRDLQRVVGQQVAQVLCDALADTQIDAALAVDEDAHDATADAFGQQHFHVRLGRREALLDLCLDVLHHFSPYNKKGGLRSPPPGAASGRR